ncbi:glycoside hydrolase family 15 protein [Caulobacter mirabilis]|uniref:Trehalase n=1 Tax=Caulobacter mirabilis TaxID=69666 RepID=A0A2D2AW11_9CAUL|nr:glycoside hydrolase family 15 protein [Caulobacter mirabilis]ATQ42176.1 glucoamylase [Caulobacter mirabilis]
MRLKIEDYALIGDCESCALVGRDGSIDWLCWPRFDSDAFLAALLGTEDHGRWRIAPTEPHTVATRRYRGDTLILETRFETETGAATVIDFMPPRGRAPELVRLVHGDWGRVTFRSELLARFGYGSDRPWVQRTEGGAHRMIAGPDMVLLRTPVGIREEKGGRLVGDFAVAEGETTPFTLTWAPSHCPVPPAISPRQALAETEQFWTDWSARGDVSGRWSGPIRRSLITLKALTHAPTGGVVAAATTSLPEQIGGPRNWDYRYCWIRDATLTLLAMMNAGYYDEAQAWRDWLLRAVAGSPADMRIMYGVGGERRLTEWEVDWLPGYEGSAPVRIGNAASTQFQLDVYGELADSLHQARRGGLTGNEAAWALERALTDHVAKVWIEPDDGIWEDRSERKHYTFSKVMAWVAVDRAVKAVENYGLPGDLERWRGLREEIRADIQAKGFDAERGTFTRAYGGKTVDASLLLLAELGFVVPDDPRFVGTVAAVEQDLLRDGFVLRYDTERVDDGLPPGEGAFLACSFWLVNAYVLLGRQADAEALFERLLAIRNDVGLLAEEYDPHAARQVGNFPQAFSHIGLINAAFNLTRGEKPAEQRAELLTAIDP